MTDQQYEMNEAQIFRADLQRAELGTLGDKRAAMEAWRSLMSEEPQTVATRVQWILDGTHGFGAMQAARRIINSPRMNQSAALGHIIAALDCMCPARYAVKAYKLLSCAEQAKVNEAITAEVSEWKENQDA